MKLHIEPTIKFEYELPADHSIDGVRVDSNGWISFLNANGSEIEVADVRRTVTHPRAKGPKVRTDQTVRGVRLSIDGLDELCEYHDVFVIDTAYQRWPFRRPRALACSLRLQFRRDGKSVRVDVADHLVYYDLVNFEGNPERAGILALVSEHAEPLNQLALRRAVVTDSDLGEHQDINTRQVALYGMTLLPPNFTVLYASADVGTEATNRVIRFCDRQAKATLRALVSGEAPTPERYRGVNGGGNLMVGRLTQSGVQASNVVLERAKGPSTAELIFEGDDGHSESVLLNFLPVP